MWHWQARWRRARHQPGVHGAPFRAGRSARNYPHLSRATGPRSRERDVFRADHRQVLTDPQHGVAAGRSTRFDGRRNLVTVTIGGNYAGYVPLLVAAGLPRLVRFIPLLVWVVRRGWTRDRDRHCRDGGVTERGRPHGAARQSPRAKVHVRRLPDTVAACGNLGATAVRRRHRLGHRVAERSSASPARRPRTPAAHGCGPEQAREHHAWSAEPWTTKPGLRYPRQARALHPTAAGHRRSPISLSRSELAARVRFLMDFALGFSGGCNECGTGREVVGRVFGGVRPARGVCGRALSSRRPGRASGPVKRQVGALGSTGAVARWCSRCGRAARGCAGREVDLEAGGLGDLGVQCHLLALIPGSERRRISGSRGP